MLECIEADLNNADQAAAVVAILDSYACDFMGGSEPLSQHTRYNLIAELRKFPTTHVFLVKLDQHFAGVAICFEGFSTFACQRLLNIHDFCVLPQFRRKGVGAVLMMYVTDYCRRNNMCKITLEVLEGNHAAKALYRESGFTPYVLDDDTGSAQFWQKEIQF